MANEKPPRRFTLIDLMALIAAAAVSFGILRTAGYTNGLVAARDVFGIGQVFANSAFAILAPATVAALGLRLLPPRPPRGELIDRPGSAACLAASGALAYSLADTCIRAGRMWAPRGKDVTWYAVSSGMYESVVLGGFGVTLCWAMLVIGGRWRPEPT